MEPGDLGSPEALAAYIAAPLPPNQIRVLYCKTCGVLTYIQFGGNQEGMGDPQRHVDWHRERGEPDAR